ncbi:hypothetical protein N9174_04735 [bacterium]|nr:hypothetical protein [bacterium]
MNRQPVNDIDALGYDKIQPNIFEVRFNFKSVLIAVLTAQVVRLFSVQDRTQPLIPLNPER